MHLSSWHERIVGQIHHSCNVSMVQMDRVFFIVGISFTNGTWRYSKKRAIQEKHGNCTAIIYSMHTCASSIVLTFVCVDRFGLRIQKQIVQMVRKMATTLPVCGRDLKILEVGCGNGNLILELARDGFCNITGIDYVEEAIEICKISLEQQPKDNPPVDMTNVHFKCVDFLRCAHADFHVGPLSFIIDKGTFDAITLNTTNTIDGDPENGTNDPSSVVNLYLTSLDRFSGPSTLFILASCNWTIDEIATFFHQSIN